MTSIVPDPNDARQVEVMARAHWDTKFHSYMTATWEQLLRIPEGAIGHRVVVQERQKMRAAIQALANLAGQPPEPTPDIARVAAGLAEKFGRQLGYTEVAFWEPIARAALRMAENGR